MERILLVCPDVTMKEDLTFFLQHSGFRVASMMGVREAMAEIGRDSPDLVLLRESSHRPNGDQLCVRIRELSDVPIIVLGQSREDANEVEMLEIGADAYLTVPLNPRTLLARIRALLRRSRATQRE